MQNSVSQQHPGLGNDNGQITFEGRALTPVSKKKAKKLRKRYKKRVRKIEIKTSTPILQVVSI